MADLDRLLGSDVAGAAARAADVPDFAGIERRGVRRRRQRAVLTAGAAAAVLALVVVVGSRWVPGPQETAPPIPAESASPTPTTVGSAIRSPAAVVQPLEQPGGTERILTWSDGADATVGAIDIRQVEVGNFAGSLGPDWGFQLQSPYPGEAALDDAERVIEYGVVLDLDGDREPDCQIGINNDNDTTGEPGDYRVWVKNLRTGETDERVGPPYGIPIDFRHPDESGGPPGVDLPPAMRFFFVVNTPGPCEGHQDAANVYMWASATDNSGAKSWDFAPDNAWLDTR